MSTNPLVTRSLLTNPTAELQAMAVAATAGSVLTAGAGGFQFSNPAPYIPQSYTFATLPATPTLGRFAVVTDSTVNTWGTAVTVGGGAITVLVWFNGVQWSVIGV